MKRLLLVAVAAILFALALWLLVPLAFLKSERGWFLGFSTRSQMNSCIAAERARFVALTTRYKDDDWKLFDFDFHGYASNVPWPFYKRFQWRILAPSDTFWLNRRPRFALGEASIDDRGVITVRKTGLVAVEVREGKNATQKIYYLLPPFRLTVTPNPVAAARNKLVTITINAVSVDGARAPATPAPVIYGDRSLEVRQQPDAGGRMFAPWTAQFFSVTSRDVQHLRVRYFDQEVRVGVHPDPNAPGVPGPWANAGNRPYLDHPAPDSASATPAELERAYLLRHGCDLESL